MPSQSDTSIRVNGNHLIKDHMHDKTERLLARIDFFLTASTEITSALLERAVWIALNLLPSTMRQGAYVLATRLQRFQGILKVECRL